MKNKLNILQFAIVVLSILLIINLLILAVNISSTFSRYKPDEGFILYRIQDSDFLYLSEDLARLEPEEIQKSTFLLEAYQVSEYFKNKNLYEIHKEPSPEKASIYQTKLDKNLENIETLSHCVKIVDELFENR